MLAKSFSLQPVKQAGWNPHERAESCSFFLQYTFNLSFLVKCESGPGNSLTQKNSL